MKRLFHCFFAHKWSPWIDMLDSDGDLVREQYRRCIRCHRMEITYL